MGHGGKLGSSLHENIILQCYNVIELMSKKKKLKVIQYIKIFYLL